MKAKSKITKITVARLYNLGNYEHVRYEICADVPKGGSAKQTLLDTVAILQGLKPIKKPIQLKQAMEALQKQPDQLDEYDKGHLDQYEDLVKLHTARVALRDAALLKLDDVGGDSKHTDAKVTWEDDDALF